jgi:hypothetical protein
MQSEEYVREGTLHALQSLEAQLDAKLQELGSLEDDDLRRIRIQRLKAIKLEAQKKEEWRIQGHGWYQEIADQKQWFDEVKNNQRVVCHFYRPTSDSCQILDKHLEILARKHIETRFIKINAEKSPFLSDRLGIEILPTIIMTKDNFTEDRIEGFDELGGTMRFPTLVLEKRLSLKGIIDIDPEEFAKSKRAAEQEAREGEDSDDDW